jgi:hypothetical protein
MRCSATRCPTGTSSRPWKAGAASRCGASPRSSEPTPRASTSAPVCTAICPPRHIWWSRPPPPARPASSTARRIGPHCRRPITATWRPGPTPSTAFTSFLIDDTIADDGLSAAGPILVSSASSKTAIAAAFLLARREEVELVGLTSPRNVEFVEGLEIYDRVLTYDAIESLDRGPATFVDVAGDAAVRLAVHDHFGDGLAHSMMVGMTHWEELRAGAGDLPGPRPTFFFAPDRVVKRSGDWGAAGLESRVADAWHPFCEWVGGWLEPIRGDGFEAVRSAYLDVLEGRVGPAQAHVLTLS